MELSPGVESEKRKQNSFRSSNRGNLSFVLSEQNSQSLFHFTNGMEIDFEARGVQSANVVFGEHHIGEAQFFSLGNALFDAVDGAYFATQSHLASHAPFFFDGRIDVARQHGGDDTEIHGKVGDTKSAGDVHEDIFLYELKAHAFFEYGQEHIEPALVETCSAALRCAVGGG